MAIKYHNTSTFAPLQICKEFYTENQIPETPQPSVDTEFPDFILVYGNVSGQRVEKTYTETSSKVV